MKAVDNSGLLTQPTVPLVSLFLFMITSILLIDDSVVDNIVVEKILAEQKVAKNIHVMHSAHDALNYLDDIEKKHQPFPEVILLDLNMPEMNGHEFMQMFTCYQHESIQGCSVFILSSSANIGDIQSIKESDREK